MAAPRHRIEFAPDAKTGVTTDGVIVTVCIEVCGPLQPAAVAVIVVVPLHPAVYVTAPFDELIVIPPAILAASRLYVMPVVAEAVAV